MRMQPDYLSPLHRLRGGAQHSAVQADYIRLVVHHQDAPGPWRDTAQGCQQIVAIHRLDQVIDDAQRAGLPSAARHLAGEQVSAPYTIDSRNSCSRRPICTWNPGSTSPPSRISSAVT